MSGSDSFEIRLDSKSVFNNTYGVKKANELWDNLDFERQVRRTLYYDSSAYTIFQRIARPDAYDRFINVLTDFESIVFGDKKENKLLKIFSNTTIKDYLKEVIKNFDMGKSMKNLPTILLK